MMWVMFGLKKKKNGDAAGKTVLLVGHCRPDAWFLRSAVGRALPGAEVLIVNTLDHVNNEISGADLLLVNRVLDGVFEGDGGIDLIRQLKANGGHSASILLISNFPEAQAEAEEAGAAPGFGKAEAGGDEAEARMRDAVGITA